MILYIDETENEKFFIVAGLVVNSQASIEKSYKSFKKSIDKTKIKPKYKAKLFTEFKSSILDNNYQKIKIKMLKEISKIPGVVIYSCYIKKNSRMNQVLKESVYISLLEGIIKNIDGKVEIIYDTFNKPDFEANIKRRAEKFVHVQSIVPKDSQNIHGLQFIDNICSTIRLYKTHGLNSIRVKSFYPLIKDMVKEVKP